MFTFLGDIEENKSGCFLLKHRVSLRLGGCDDLCAASIANPAEERLRLELLGSQKLDNLESIPASDANQTVFVKLGLGVYKIIQLVRSQFQCVLGFSMDECFT